MAKSFQSDPAQPTPPSPQMDDDVQGDPVWVCFSDDEDVSGPASPTVDVEGNPDDTADEGDKVYEDEKDDEEEPKPAQFPFSFSRPSSQPSSRPSPFSLLSFLSLTRGPSLSASPSSSLGRARLDLGFSPSRKPLFSAFISRRPSSLESPNPSHSSRRESRLSRRRDSLFRGRCSRFELIVESLISLSLSLSRCRMASSSLAEPPFAAVSPLRFSILSGSVGFDQLRRGSGIAPPRAVAFSRRSCLLRFQPLDQDPTIEIRSNLIPYRSAHPSVLKKSTRENGPFEGDQDQVYEEEPPHWQGFLWWNQPTRVRVLDSALRGACGDFVKLEDLPAQSFGDAHKGRVAVGKSVLNGALGYAKSALAEEVALQLGVQQDQAFITDELEMMQSG
ncbi:hypothetical protein HU200_034451 [Digitaria exilis]|uniref:Uncharacterized protein n=1 Tax=Digitaria exilis TaxID=1010633 RepID=A0A835BV63_9POAL|nr:hypothetical protein HU200_034451 [Digitaria exilis]